MPFLVFLFALYTFVGVMVMYSINDYCKIPNVGTGLAIVYSWPSFAITDQEEIKKIIKCR